MLASQGFCTSFVTRSATSQLTGSIECGIRLSRINVASQGPGKRPAVFSHDKLVWELQQDAVTAAMADAQPCTPAVAPPYVPLQISALRHELVQ